MYLWCSSSALYYHVGYVEKRRCPAQQSINEKNQPKFNGFCFAVNIEKIEAAAFEPKVHLFDPKDRIVGQEDSLTQRMEKANLYPILLHCSFVFHFKSRTVSAANFTYFQELLHRNNATVVEKASYPTVLIEYKPEKNKKYTFAVDIRENLQWYHPTDGASGSPTLSQPKDTGTRRLLLLSMEACDASHLLPSTSFVFSLLCILF